MTVNKKIFVESVVKSIIHPSMSKILPNFIQEVEKSEPKFVNFKPSNV